MKTDDLITMLASGAQNVEANAVQRRYATALGWGGFGATLLMAVMLGVRPDLAEAALLPMFWVKFALPASLLAGGLLAVVRLSRPGVPLGRVSSALVAPVIVIWLLAAVALIGAAPEARSALIFGETWKTCPFNVTLLSMPSFVALMWAMRGLAPTQLALSGAAAGLLSGAIGATVYALHCPEMQAPFLAIWYLIGMLIPTALGALLGPRLLRW